MATENNLACIYLLICSTLKLGSNPGALDSRIGYLALHANTTCLKSRVIPYLHSSPSTVLTKSYATGLNLSGLNTLIRIKLNIFFSMGVAYIFIYGKAYSGLLDVIKVTHLSSLLSMWLIKFVNRGYYDSYSICLSWSSFRSPFNKVFDNLVLISVVGLIKRLNS